MQSTWERGTKAEDGYGTTTLTLYTEYNHTAATHQLTLTLTSDTLTPMLGSPTQTKHKQSLPPAYTLMSPISRTTHFRYNELGSEVAVCIYVIPGLWPQILTSD